MNDFPPLIFTALMVTLTAATHLIGLMGLLRFAGYHVRHWRAPWIWLDQILVPMLMVLGLFLIHFTEIVSYAVLFWSCNAATNWNDALFISAGAYSTMGFEGTPIARQWKLVTAMEAMNGLLLTGWSTAFLFQNLHRILIDEEDHPLPVSAIAKEVLEEIEN